MLAGRVRASQHSLRDPVGQRKQAQAYGHGPGVPEGEEGEGLDGTEEQRHQHYEQDHTGNEAVLILGRLDGIVGGCCIVAGRSDLAGHEFLLAPRGSFCSSFRTLSVAG